MEELEILQISVNKHNSMNYSLQTYLHPRERRKISREVKVLAVKIIPPRQL
jgi:hypothetical protein